MYTFTNIFCWTDALDCVYWINNSSKVWPKFVQGKVLKIRNNVGEVKWLHCPGALNPADIHSRGLDISLPELNEKWRCGPEFFIEKR